MKKIQTLLLLACLGPMLWGQTAPALSQNFAEIEKLKSQNLKDAFATFYQIALKNSDVNEKSLNLNGSLFSLYYAHDKAKVQQYSEDQIRFLRNFNLNAKINLNDDYQYQGYAVGFQWAIINARDTKFMNLTQDEAFMLYDELLLSVLREAVTPLEDAILNGQIPAAEQAAQFQKLLSLMSQVIRDELDAVRKDPLGKQLLTLCDQQIAKNAQLQAIGMMTTNDLVQKRKERYRQLIADTEKLPFWSVNPYAKTDTQGRINQGAFESIFLWSGKRGELDVRAKYNYADTLSTGVREKMGITLGYNFKWGATQDEVSVFEVKFSGAYQRVFRGLLADEAREKLSAVADIKFRLSENFILPFTLQYDPKQGKLFGFLNLTYNFNLKP